MKNSIGKLTVLSVLIGLLLVSSTYGLKCDLKQNCAENEAIILCLSSKTNAHAELPVRNGCPNYNWKVCCEGATNDCNGYYTEAAWLTDFTNSHASIDQEGYYTVPVCISGYKLGTKCRVGTSGECLFSLSAENNAHFAGCDGEDSYNTKISCTAISDEDEDNYSADIDCNDNDEAVNPEVKEVGDGVDNNCNGLIDGDDPQMNNFPKGWYQLSEKAGFSGFQAGGVIADENFRFLITESGKKGILSKKIKIDNNQNYFASVNASCEVTLQLIFDNTTAATNVSSGIFGSISDFLFGENLVNSVVGNGRIITSKLNSGDSSYAKILIIAEENGCIISKPQLERAAKQVADYNDLIQPINFESLEIKRISASSCCPMGECWNGFTCIENMANSTFLIENVSGEAIYRCVDGEWVFGAFLYDWNQQGKGFCSVEGQCFVLSSMKGGSSSYNANDFYQGKYPLCINNGEFIFDHYCDNGKWSSRTKFMATKLLEVGQNDEYVLYCNNFKDTLVQLDQKDNYLSGEFTSSGDESLSSSIFGVDESQQTNICFKEITDPEGRRLVPDKDNTCINNVCVLKYKQSGNFKDVFATTLNKNLTDPNSFLVALDVPQEQLNEVCNSGDSNFVECNLNTVGLEGQMWYSSGLNGLIYGKEGVSLAPSTMDNILNWFRGLFRTESNLSNERLFISEAQNFRDLYLLNQNDLKVRAMKEILGEAQQMLVAEYENYNTSVCDYVNNLDLPVGLQTQLLEEASGRKKINCNRNGNLQNVEIVGEDKDLSLFFKQLTGSLRVNNE